MESKLFRKPQEREVGKTLGLDSYLYKRTQHFAGMDEKVEAKIREVKSGQVVYEEEISADEELETRVRVAHWRKANEIHKWFIDNCGSGEDDGNDVYVDRENLEKLLKICKRVKKSIKLVEQGTCTEGYFDEKGGYATREVPYHVIEDPTLCKKLLPTQAGFFFGSTKYDKWYVDDIDLTIKQLEKILSEEEKDIPGAYVDYIYYASW